MSDFNPQPFPDKIPGYKGLPLKVVLTEKEAPTTVHGCLPGRCRGLTNRPCSFARATRKCQLEVTPRSSTSVPPYSLPPPSYNYNGQISRRRSYHRQ